MLTDNGSCYRSRAFAAALGAITHSRTRPYRPATNGKVERFHRTLADEWAYARPWSSDAERAQAYPDWLHRYNHHRGHTALSGRPPASRLTNLSGQNSQRWQPVLGGVHRRVGHDRAAAGGPRAEQATCRSCNACPQRRSVSSTSPADRQSPAPLLAGWSPPARPPGDDGVPG